MRKTITLILIMATLISCNNEKEKKEEELKSFYGKYVCVEHNMSLDFKEATSVLIEGLYVMAPNAVIGGSYVKEGQIIRVNTNVEFGDLIFTIKDGNIIGEGVLDGNLFIKAK